MNGLDIPWVCTATFALSFVNNFFQVTTTPRVNGMGGESILTTLSCVSHRVWKKAVIYWWFLCKAWMPVRKIHSQFHQEIACSNSFIQGPFKPKIWNSKYDHCVASTQGIQRIVNSSLLLFHRATTLSYLVQVLRFMHPIFFKEKFVYHSNWYTSTHELTENTEFERLG